jgi:hypothetical protein
MIIFSAIAPESENLPPPNTTPNPLSGVLGPGGDDFKSKAGRG